MMMVMMIIIIIMILIMTMTMIIITFSNLLSEISSFYQDAFLQSKGYFHIPHGGYLSAQSSFPVTGHHHHHRHRYCY